ncbi:hypothetical protein P2W68_01445 [Chryseobacterium arthrosphaerae]|uniref:RipA family octameric membrane protein n=1 Tax=Chryseobacterium arthrosphaerae TaxID=651561 RepID=UPI0023E1E912|nr:hypothetical protein [Chryseobacterium arthrosphaerae]WES98289.1 hypothetical protein P2W68_01445 [Chryseobacterium arthrosphaerae]
MIEDKKKIEFEKALESRQFEISNFWSRGWFFGALILALIAGYFENASLKTPIFPTVCISFLITLFSLLQTLMNRGSKYWQERWEYITKNRESSLGIDVTKTMKYNNSEKYYVDRSILSKGESWLTRGQRFSVSKLAFMVWDIIFLTAILCWINDIIQCTNLNKINIVFTAKIFFFHIVITIYIICFWIKGRVFEDIRKTHRDTLENSQENEFYDDCKKYINDDF